MNQEHHPIWFACDEHIDIVIDEIVDHYSLAPTMELLPQETENQSKACSWCGQAPQYQLELDLEEE